MLKSEFIAELSDHHVGNLNLAKARLLEISLVVDSRSTTGQPVSDIPMHDKAEFLLPDRAMLAGGVGQSKKRRIKNESAGGISVGEGHCIPYCTFQCLFATRADFVRKGGVEPPEEGAGRGNLRDQWILLLLWRVCVSARSGIE